MDRSDCLFGRRGGRAAAEPAEPAASAGDGCGRAATTAPASHVLMLPQEMLNLGALTKDLVRCVQQLIIVCVLTGAGFRMRS